MIYTRCSKCQTTHPQGTKCPKCATKHNQKYNKKRGAEVKFYQSTQWKNMRARVIAYYNNIDIWILGLLGTLVPASRTVVHHITPFGEDKSKALDFDNLIPLSTASHNQIHDQFYDTGRREEAIDIIRKGIALFERLKNGDYNG